MSFLPGIFGQRQQQPNQQQSQQSQQQPQQQQNPQGQQSQGQNQLPTNGNGSGGPAGGQQGGPQNSQMQGQGSNPLDSLWGMMQPSQEVQQQYQQQQQQQTAPLFGNMKPEDVSAQVKKTNFAASIDPQKTQKALGGDPQAFMEVINEVAQNAFQASLQMTQGMVEHGVKTGTDRFSSTLDSRFRNFQLNNQNSENPALQHPMGKALLDVVKKQILTANPRLSPQEVHAKAESGFMEFAKLLNPQTQPGEGQGKEQPSMDWLNFLDSPTNSQ